MPSPRQLEPSLEESIVLTLFDLVNHMTKNGERMAGLADLTVRQWIVLLQVAGDPNFPALPGTAPSEGSGAREESITASEIAAERGVTRANIGAVVATLLEKGLVEQTEMPDDRRRKGLSVTAEGRARLEAIEAERRRANRALFAGRSPAELESLRAMLAECLERLALERLAEEAGEGVAERWTAAAVRDTQEVAR